MQKQIARYLFFDPFQLFHIREELPASDLSNLDLVLQLSPTKKIKIPFGLRIVEYLTLLQKKRNLKLVFFCYEPEDSQYNLYKQIFQECLDQKTTLFSISAMAVCDPIKYANISSLNPIKKAKKGIQIVCYGQKLNRKACLLNSLCHLLQPNGMNKKEIIILEKDENEFNKLRDDGWVVNQIKEKNENTVFENILYGLKVDCNNFAKILQTPPATRLQYTDAEILANFPDSSFYCSFEKKEFSLERKELTELNNVFKEARNPICIVGPAGSGKSTLISQFLAKNESNSVIVWLDAHQENIFYNQMKIFCRSRCKNSAFFIKNNIAAIFFDRLLQISQHKKLILIIENVKNEQIIQDLLPKFQTQSENFRIVLSSEVKLPEIYCIILQPFDQSEISKVFYSNLLSPVKPDEVDEMHKICGSNIHAANQLTKLLSFNWKFTLNDIIDYFKQFDEHYALPIENDINICIKTLLLNFKIHENLPEIQFILTIMCLLEAHKISRYLLENILKRSLKNIIQKMEDLSLVRLNNHELCQIVSTTSTIYQSMKCIIKMFGCYAQWDDFLIKYFAQKKNIFLGDGIPSINLSQFKHYIFQQQKIESILKLKKTSLLMSIPKKQLNKEKIKYCDDNRFEINVPTLIFCFARTEFNSKVLSLIEVAKKIYGEDSLKFLLTKFFIGYFDVYSSMMKCDINKIFNDIEEFYNPRSEEFITLKNLYVSWKERNNLLLVQYFSTLISELNNNKIVSTVQFIAVIIFIINSTDRNRLNELLFKQIDLMKPSQENLVIKFYSIWMEKFFGGTKNQCEDLKKLMKEDQKINKHETFISFAAGIMYLAISKELEVADDLHEFTNIMDKAILSYEDSLCGFEDFIYLLIAKGAAALFDYDSSFNLLFERDQICDTKFGSNFLLKYDILFEIAQMNGKNNNFNDEIIYCKKILEIVQPYNNLYDLSEIIDTAHMVIMLRYLQLEDNKNFQVAYGEFLQLLSTPKILISDIKKRVKLIDVVKKLFQPCRKEWVDLTEKELVCLQVLEPNNYLDKLLNYAVTFCENGFNQKAVEKFKEYNEKTLSKIEYKHEGVVKSMINLSKSLYCLCRLDEAIIQLKSMKKYFICLPNKEKIELKIERYSMLAQIYQIKNKKMSLIYFEKLASFLNPSDNLYWNNLFLKNTILLQLNEIDNVTYVAANVKKKASNTLVYCAAYHYELKEFEIAENLLDIVFARPSTQELEQNILLLNATTFLIKTTMHKEDLQFVLDTWKLIDERSGHLENEFPIYFYEYFRIGALLELQTGNIDRSETLLNKSYEILKGISSDFCLELAKVLLNLGELYIAKKDFTSAQKKLNEANKIYEKTLASKNNDTDIIQKLLDEISAVN